MERECFLGGKYSHRLLVAYQLLDKISYTFYQLRVRAGEEVFEKHMQKSHGKQTDSRKSSNISAISDCGYSFEARSVTTVVDTP